jgi:urease accessory protein
MLKRFHPIQPEFNPSLGSWHGRLQLTYARHSRGTQVVHSFAQAPFKVQRPFYPEGNEICHSVILHTAGGIVGGDRLSMHLQLEPNAQALVTTAAATKVYRTNGQDAQQVVHIQVGTGASLEWFPQETIVFAGAEAGQQFNIELAPEALWMGWDVTRLGRSARGEQFLQGNWRSQTEVWQQGRLLWVDPQWIPGDRAVWHSPHGLANRPVVGSFAMLGRTVEPDVVTAVRSHWDNQNSTAEIGVTRLMSGILCRYRGTSTSEAKQWFTTVWGLLRQLTMGRSPCVPRIWPT